MNDTDYYRKQLTEFSHRAFRRHLVGGTGGNLSLRLPETDTVLVTPTGISLEEVQPEEHILVNHFGPGDFKACALRRMLSPGLCGTAKLRD
jgi:ribulose-5-phosphate 4-epimerase/fuculose-1-phosphate aldolase